MKCAIYARVSTKKQETAKQLTRSPRLCQRMEWEAVEYIEQASSVKYRPEFERLLATPGCGSSTSCWFGTWTVSLAP